MNILSLDLSTTATGWAWFVKGELKDYGVLKPQLEKEEKKAKYPLIQLFKLISLALQIRNLAKTLNPDKIIIEEVNRGKNRLGQKTLNGAHWFVIGELFDCGMAERILYFDSDGAEGWRSRKGLKLQLSAQDKLLNKERRKLNKSLSRKDQLALITQKTLAVNFVNAYYNLNLTEKENDIADAIGLGHFFIHVVEA